MLIPIPQRPEKVTGAKMIWLPDMDLNHDKQIQSLLCYRYTIGQAGACGSVNLWPAESSRWSGCRAARQGLSRTTIRLITMGLLSILFGCSRPELVEGGLYHTRNENGSFSVLKILKLDEQGVHVRLYSNRFSTQPAELDESTLYMV